MVATPGAPPTDGRDAGPPPTRLLLVRHAVTEQTGPLLSGRTPGIDLSDAGRDQAEALAGRLAAVPIAAVYSSPMERTRQTAGAVAARHALAVEEVEGLLEADYGDWTGGALAELARTELWSTVQRAPSRARFPGGEALTAMQARIVVALDALVAAHPGQTIVAVSHADPLKAAIAHLTGLHLDLFQRIVLSPASVSVVDVGPIGAVLLTCNATADLAALLGAAAPAGRAAPARSQVGAGARTGNGAGGPPSPSGAGDG